MNRSEANMDPDSFTMSNDFDIIEHFSDDDVDSSNNDLPSPTYDPSGFPKAKHRSLLKFSLSKPQEYDDSVLKPLEEMSLDEIRDAQNFLYEKLGKEMCDFIKGRKLKRMEESKNMEKEKETQQVEPKLVNQQNGAIELIFKFDRNEFLKYQWMNPSESNKDDSTDHSPGKLNLHELRFDFEGRLLTYSEPTDKCYDTSLYNHGLDSDRPGYTFVELVDLLQSSFKPQVQISVRTLANVLFQSYLQYDSLQSPHLSDSPFNSYHKCFFSYPQYRWKNYINNDLDLISKVGYSVCENQLSLSILVDSLRCLSLLLFGDRCTWNNFDSLDPNGVVQVQDVLFDYYQFYMGIDMYYWNPHFLDLMETNLFGGSDSIFENEYGNTCNKNNSNKDNNNINNNTNNNKDKKHNNSNTTGSNNNNSLVSLRLKMFYSRCLEGHYQSSSVEEIVKDLFGVIDQHKCKDKKNSKNNNKGEKDTEEELIGNENEIETQVEPNEEFKLKMNSTLFLISKNNILYKLLLIMQRYKDNIKVQLYCISSICGFVRYFGTPLAKALVGFPLFKDHFEWMAEFLLLDSNQNKGLLHLESAVLYLVKYLSVHLDDLRDFFGTSSAVSVLKHTITKSFTKELKSLNMITDVEFNRNEEENMVSNRYAVTALNCMTVWSVKEYMFDALDEFVPVVNLMMFQVKDLVKDKNKLNLFFKENSEKLSAFNLHFASCIRLNEMHNHFEFNGVMRNVNELVNLFAAENLWSDDLGYYLYSLLQLQYDYVVRNVEEMEELNKEPERIEEKLKDLEFSESCLVMILEMVSDLFVYGDVEFPEQLVLLPFFDQENFGGSDGCMYNERLVRSHFNKYILPFNCLNLILNTLLRLKLVGHKGSEVNNNNNNLVYDLIKLVSLPIKLKEKLFNLGEDMIKTLKRVYFNLHDTKRFYLYCSAYLVKSVPVFESWLAYLRTLVDLGFDDPDAVFAILALSVDYGLIENTLDLLSTKYGLTGVEDVFKCFEKFNRYVSGYSLGSDRMPLASFLSFLTYLPLLTNLNHNLNMNGNSNCDKEIETKQTEIQLMNSTLFLLRKLVNGRLSTKILEWTFPRYLFSQLVYTLGSDDSDNLFSEFTNDHYFVFQKLLFDILSATCSLRVVESEDILDRWVDSLDKFVPNDDYTGPRLSEYFRDEQEMLIYCNKLVCKFSSGHHDSPVTVGLIMLFSSYLSNEECSKTVWSDDCLMILLGRNLCFEFDNFELSHTYDSELVDKFSVGNIFTFASPFSSTTIIRSQVKLMKNFSDDSVINRDPVLFLTLLSLWKNLGVEELGSILLESRSGLIREILNRLTKIKDYE